MTGGRSRLTDKWLRLGNPWEIPRPERHAYDVKFGGRTEHAPDEHGRDRVRWIPEKCVKGVAYDTPVSGFRTPTANLLRLWRAEATESFDFDAFNVGDYYGAVDQKVISETITKVLYPNDEPEAGKRLRLGAAVLLRLLLAAGHDPPAAGDAGRRLQDFASSWAVQLNDTHPSIAVAELMRLLVDEHGMDWDAAWAITEAQLRLHEPHADGRSARAVAGGRCSASSCRATSRSSTRSTGGSSTTCGGGSRATKTWSDGSR